MLLRRSDGSFNLQVSERNSKVSTSLYRKVILTFAICLNIRDEEIIKGLVSFFKLLDIPDSANLKVLSVNNSTTSIDKSSAASSSAALASC
jgi:hypothetical protein